MARRYPRLLRRNQTRAESAVRGALRDRRLNGWTFRRQWPIDRYVVDFACLDAKLVVEIDGARHSTESEAQRDDDRTRAIEACGFQVIRFGNDDVMGNLEGVRETILAAVERRDHL